MAPAIGLSLALLLPATYSIIAVDSADGTVGAAGASCVRSNVIRILGVARGQGVVHAQAYMNPEGRDHAVDRLAAGVAPEEIISAITDSQFDPDFERRQYGVVDRHRRFATFTGAETDAHASHQNGFDGRFAWSVQGNLLTGAPVIERTVDAFLAGACDLPERLLRAMEAGAQNGEGDHRCTPSGIPADSAFIAVVSPLGESEDLVFVADEATTTSPLVSLRAQLDEWRVFHPCPSPAEDAGLGSKDAGLAADVFLADSGEAAAPDSCRSVGITTPIALAIYVGLLGILAIRRRSQGGGTAERSRSPRPSTTSAPAGPRNESVRSSLS